MKNLYLTRAALFMGLTAFAGTSVFAAGEGTWRNINSQIKAPSFVTGWSGNLTQVGEGIGENYNGAFELYQVLSDLPAGNYKLTANAFYRCGDNEYSKENMKDGANHNAVLFLGSAQTKVAGLFDADADAAPNSLAEAKTAFSEGKYLNTVEFVHEGGDLRFGILNTGGRNDEWCAFDNFKLEGPNGEVAIVNGDFENMTFAVENDWDFANNANSSKLPDTPLGLVQTKTEGEGDDAKLVVNQSKVDEYNGKVTGVFRKTNASVYDFGTKVELEAGKYRFGVQSFFRYAPGNTSGKYMDVKAYEEKAGKSGLDIFTEGKEDETKFAYLYATNGTSKEADYMKPQTEEMAKMLNAEAFYNKQNIMSLFSETMEAWPENEPTYVEQIPSPDDATVMINKPNEDGYSWCDSGYEFYAAKYFVNNLDKYRNYVEFELTEKTVVWLGLAIVNRPTYEDGTNTQYWNPARDFTLEKWYEEVGVEGIDAADANAPVEYYNLQGVRVANPENGLYIVKQGNKSWKQVIR